MKQRRGARGAALQPKPIKKPAKPRPAYMTVPIYGIVCSLLVLMLRAGINLWYEDVHSRADVRAITPLAAEKVSDLPQFQGEHRERLYWGTYRSHLYFGLRTRSPTSLLVGLMWVGIKDGRLSLRHTCEESDGLERYGWLKHDGSTYGYQELVDKSMLISTSFVKNLDPATGYGGDWAVRIKVDGLKEEKSEQYSSLIFYIHDEEGGVLNLSPQHAAGDDSPVVSGFSKDINNWELHMLEKGGATINYAGLNTPHIHNFTELVTLVLEEQIRTNGRLQLPNQSHQQSNTAVFQVTGNIPLELDVTFVSGVTEIVKAQERVKYLSGKELSNKLVKHAHTFDERFHSIFHLNDKVDERTSEVGKAAISNLLGGIGYFFGQSRIAFPPGSKDESSKDIDLSYWPAALFTAVPSRSFFPRGFLWDEGFHQLLISRWDTNLSMDVIGHWLDLMNVDGWIPREQILGSEARSKVPSEFIVQHTDNANPPTLFLVLNELAKKVTAKQTHGDNTVELEFLERSLPRLKAWFKWFNTTQIGKAPGSYFWHGRDPGSVTELNPKTLTSGLDDYPRASHPSSDERHVDLRCWMALAARTISLISKIIGKPDQAYEATAEELSNFELLNSLHYDSQTGSYYDFGNHTEEVKLQAEIIQDPRTGYSQRVLRRSTLSSPKLGWVPHVGYVNLFPFLMRLIPSDSPVLEQQLNLISDEKLMWSEFGLRSLATTSSLYMQRNTEHDAPYWRGPIWINLNYLVLSALRHYSEDEGPYSAAADSLYQRLRANLLRNIVEEYHRSGYLWEQYDQTRQGSGKGSHPFTGWTALVVLFMAEIY